MTSTNTPRPSNLPIVIIDTNIFGSLFDINSTKDTLAILVDLLKGHRLYVSKITMMEIISKGTKDISAIMKVFKAFALFEIDDDVLTFAGLMFFAGIRGHMDSIIASTAFLNNTLLLTANQKDFPEPLFSERFCWHVHYKDDNNRTKTDNIYLLSVNPENVGKKLQSIDYVKGLTNNPPPYALPKIDQPTTLQQNTRK